MNAEIKSQWVDALRSGKYTQGENALRETVNGKTAHCCLGVLCELALESGLTVRIEEDVVDLVTSQDRFTSFDGDAAYLPESVQRWSDISTSNGQFFKEDESRAVTLSALNDTGYSFTEIADLIEKHF